MSAFSFGGYAVHWNDDLDSIILIIPFEFFLNSDKSHTFSVAVILSIFSLNESPKNFCNRLNFAALAGKILVL